MTCSEYTVVHGRQLISTTRSSFIVTIVFQPLVGTPFQVYARVAVVDFTVTMAGFEQQLLGHVIQQEKVELEEERAKLVEEVNANEKRLKLYEDRLLEQLSASKGNLIEDEDLMSTLSDAKRASMEVAEKLSTAVDTRKRINAAREEYRPVAVRGAVLYFLIVEMSLVNHMYQTSLSRFLGLFDVGIEQAETHQVSSTPTLCRGTLYLPEIWADLGD